MKKIIIFLCLLLLTGIVSRAQWSAGAGYLRSDLVSRDAPGGVAGKAVFDGLYAGASYTLPLAYGISFVPGLYYEYLAQGAKTEGHVLDFIGETREHYFSVPLSFSCGVSLLPELRLVLYAGPTFRVGLDSVTSYSLGWDVHEFEVLKGGLSDHNYNNGDYSRFDILVGGGVALELFGRVRLQMGYDAGLLNRYIGELDGARTHARRLSAGIAYLF